LEEYWWETSEKGLKKLMLRKIKQPYFVPLSDYIRQNPMEKQTIEERITNYLQMHDEILFAFVFGSFLTKDNYRDIDIAVYFKETPGLLALGALQSELGEIIKTNIDVIILNSLPEKSPVMAHQVVSTGKLLKNSDDDALITFRENTMQQYFDTAYLRAQMNKAFEKRLDKHAFGKRNFLMD
jgi:predicted nucleotidyltransferase